MKRMSLIAAVAAFLGTSAQSHDGDTGSCSIESWVWNQRSGILTIEGVTTCAEGWLHLRLYTPDGQYLGNDVAIIEGHAFTAMKVLSVPGNRLEIRYSVSE